MSVFPEGPAYIYYIGVLCANLGVYEDLIHPGVAAGRNLVVGVACDDEVIGAAFLGPEGRIIF